ncbi:MAG: hypothetical protein M1813_009698 [Trichoglossum hirsutum]|nr:MAG: hypothetical protein M1813_009698 [Trichoglossum hirsutum]
MDAISRGPIVNLVGCRMNDKCIEGYNVKWKLLQRSVHREEALQHGRAELVGTYPSDAIHSIFGEYIVWYCHNLSPTDCVVNWEALSGRTGCLSVPKPSQERLWRVNYAHVNENGFFYMRASLYKSYRANVMCYQESIYYLPSGQCIWSHTRDRSNGKPIALGLNRLYLLFEDTPEDGQRSYSIEALSLYSGECIYRSSSSRPLSKNSTLCDYKLICDSSEREYLICFMKPPSGFKIIDGATGLEIQEVEDRLSWRVAAARRGLDGFLVWSNTVMVYPTGLSYMFQQTMSRQPDGRFTSTNVSLIGYPGGVFLADVSTGFGLTINSRRVNIFSISPEPVPKLMTSISIPRSGCFYGHQFLKRVTFISPRTKRKRLLPLEEGDGELQLLDIGRWAYRTKERLTIVDFGCRSMDFTSTQALDCLATLGAERFVPPYVCKYSDIKGCSLFRGKFFSLAANKFSREQLEVVPKEYRLWCCAAHQVLQQSRGPVDEWRLVQEQVDKLRVWGGVADWVIKFRNDWEGRLKRNLGDRSANQPPTLCIGRECVRSASLVWFIGLTEQQLSSFLELMVIDAEKTSDLGSMNVQILPYREGEYQKSRWYRQFSKAMH